MTQVKGAQQTSAQLAWRNPSPARTLAQRRADIEEQIRALSDEAMGLAELEKVSERLKALRKRTGLNQYEVAEGINKPHRTFQSWEGGKVETSKENYGLLADFYSERLGETVTTNWILFGQNEEPPIQAPGLGEILGFNGEPAWAAEIKSRLDELGRDVGLLLQHAGLEEAERAASEPPPEDTSEGQTQDDEPEDATGM